MTKPDPDKIRRQLDRLLASPEFARTDRMARFLRYVVEHSARGRTDALRERQIGIEVFDRPPDWDPKLDNVVRSEARRLRDKLNAYAASASPDETVRIAIPKGSYIAEFVDLRPETVSALVESPGALHLPEPMPRQRYLRRLAVLVPTGAAVLGISLLLAGVLRRSPARANGDDFEIVPFSTEVGQQFSPSISPDGSRVAYVWDGAGTNLDIYIKDVKSGAVQRFTHDSAPDLHPAWSPDGKQIAFLRGAQSTADVILKNVESGLERRIGTIENIGGGWASDNLYTGCQSPTWSPDGKRLILTDAPSSAKGLGLVAMSVTTGEKTALSSPMGVDQDCYPRFSPNGREIAFVRYVSHGVGDIYTMSSDGGAPRQLSSDHRTIRGLDWSADGKRLVFATNRAGSYEIRTIGSEGGDSQTLPSDTASASEPAVARDGGWMVYVESAENWNIWRVRIENGRYGKRLGQPERFLASTGQNHSPSYSPDGSTIAFVSNRSGNPEIWLANADGTHLRQITHFNGPWLGTLRWSPDAKNIVFDARPRGHSAIFTISVASGEPKLLEQENFEDRRPAWSRDGKSIYFDTTRSGRPQIWKRDLETGVARPIAPPATMAPTESIDGQTLYFVSSVDSEPHYLWTSRPDGSGAMQIPDIRPDPILDWTVCADGIIFAVAKGASASVYFYGFSDRAIHPMGELVQSLSPGTPSLVVSPDGKWLLFAATDYTKSDIKIRREAAVPKSSLWISASGSS
jgi:Tol biopolymer transport system component